MKFHSILFSPFVLLLFNLMKLEHETHAFSLNNFQLSVDLSEGHAKCLTKHTYSNSKFRVLAAREEPDDDELLHRDLEGFTSGEEADEDSVIVSWDQLLPKWANREAELTVEQIEIIRMSWDSIKYHPPGVDKLVSDFYDRIWEEAPSLKKLFSLDLSKQHGKFSAAFDLLIKLLDQEDTMKKEMKSLAERHVGYGAKAADYPVFINALLYSIEQYSPLLWSPKLLGAWMDLFSIVLETVLPVAWEHDQKSQLDHTLEGSKDGEEESSKDS
mmetsp:Transcript_7731/g.10090  ORF Transcript_7731/g.10090 Transcript_7731/m.10090 type:complete len:271 (+) Transcript_7731:311-1123(+)